MPPSVARDNLYPELEKDGKSEDSPLHLAVISGDYSTVEMILPVVCPRYFFHLLCNFAHFFLHWFF